MRAACVPPRCIANAIYILAHRSFHRRFVELRNEFSRCPLRRKNGGCTFAGIASTFFRDVHLQEILWGQKAVVRDISAVQQVRFLRP